MSRRVVSFAAVVAGCAALAVTAGQTVAFAASVGFVDLPRLVASHPLYRVLAEYDSEIAALRSTQNVAALRDPAAAAARSATALQAEATAAAARAQVIGRHDPTTDRAREQAAIAQLTLSERAAGSGMATYTAQLASETDANLRAYREALSERSERAYAARKQQLREKELTLAYDLARRDAAKRVTLRLKLDDLHLDSKRRANLEAELAALNAAEERGVGAMRRADAAQLTTYRAQLERDAAANSGEMDQQLRSGAGANYTILQRVFHEAGNGFQALPLPSQLVAFTRSYAASSNARAIASGMQTAGRDLSQRFRQIAAVDAQSQRDAAAQLRTLEADRDALYRSIVAQVKAEALTLARRRALGGVEFVNTTPKAGRLDLTPAIAARIARHS